MQGSLIVLIVYPPFVVVNHTQSAVNVTECSQVLTISSVINAYIGQIRSSIFFYDEARAYQIFQVKKLNSTKVKLVQS